jgi:hypothetical protein
MKRQLLTAILVSAAAAIASLAHAQNEVYLCVGENGQKEYKNTGITKGCKKVELPGITTVPAPVRRPGIQTASVKSPSDFPKVDGGTQKARDNDRRQILLDEMKAEEQKLANLKKDYNSGEPERQGDERNYAKYQERVATMKDDMDRTEKNIDALRRELSNLK